MTGLWERSRPWVLVGIGAALLAVTGAGTLAALGHDVRIVPVVVIGIAGSLAISLLLDALGPAHLPTGRHHLADPWRVRHAIPFAADGRDHLVLLDARAMTAELGGRRPSPDLHDRLRWLARDQLRAAYALDIEDARSRELLGERVHGLLTGPPRRLAWQDLLDIVDRIEDL